MVITHRCHDKSGKRPLLAVSLQRQPPAVFKTAVELGQDTEGTVVYVQVRLPLLSVCHPSRPDNLDRLERDSALSVPLGQDG